MLMKLAFRVCWNYVRYLEHLFHILNEWSERFNNFLIRISIKSIYVYETT